MKCAEEGVVSIKHFNKPKSNCSVYQEMSVWSKNYTYPSSYTHVRDDTSNIFWLFLVKNWFPQEPREQQTEQKGTDNWLFICSPSVNPMLLLLLEKIAVCHCSNQGKRLSAQDDLLLYPYKIEKKTFQVMNNIWSWLKMSCLHLARI